MKEELLQSHKDLKKIKTNSKINNAWHLEALALIPVMGTADVIFFFCSGNIHPPSSNCTELFRKSHMEMRKPQARGGLRPLPGLRRRCLEGSPSSSTTEFPQQTQFPSCPHTRWISSLERNPHSTGAAETSFPIPPFHRKPAPALGIPHFDK